MSSIEAHNNIKQPLHDAMVETYQLLEKNPNEPVLLSISKQLLAINECVEAGDVPAEDVKEAINIEVVAVREFETSRPTYAESLMKVNYYFDRL